VSEKSESENTFAVTPADDEIIRRLREEIVSGKHWYIALLEAVGRWQSSEEEYKERNYRYLIDDTALDWLLLAERLCEAVDGLVSENEKSDLLIRNKPPLDISREQFRNLLGESRYTQYLNYFYGVTLERALVLAVEAEVRKERRLAGFAKERDTSGEAYRRIYGETESDLLDKFRKEKHYKQLKSIGLQELKEFTYWLFKFRIRYSDKELVASDTKKALDWARRHGLSQKMAFGGFPAHTIENL